MPRNDTDNLGSDPLDLLVLPASERDAVGRVGEDVEAEAQREKRFSALEKFLVSWKWNIAKDVKLLPSVKYQITPAQCALYFEATGDDDLNTRKDAWHGRLLDYMDRHGKDSLHPKTRTPGLPLDAAEMKILMAKVQRFINENPLYEGYLPEGFSRPTVPQIGDFVEGKGAGRMSLELVFGNSKLQKIRRWVSEKTDKSWKVGKKEDLLDLRAHFIPTLSIVLDNYRSQNLSTVASLTEGVRTLVSSVVDLQTGNRDGRKFRLESIGDNVAPQKLAVVVEFYEFIDRINELTEKLAGKVDEALRLWGKKGRIEGIMDEVPRLDRAIGFDSVQAKLLNAGTTADVAALAGIRPQQIGELLDAGADLQVIEDDIVVTLYEIYRELLRAPKL